MKSWSSAVAGANGGMDAPVFLAESRRDRLRRFPEAARKFRRPSSPRPGLVVFGPAKASVESDGRRAGLGIRQLPEHPVLCPHRRLVPHRRRAPAVRRSFAAARRAADAPESATSSPNRRKSRARWKPAPRWISTAPAPGSRPGWPTPSPMGSLDYVSPDATLVAAFVVKNPAADHRRSGRCAAALSGGCPAGHRRASAEGRVRCPQRPGSEPGRRVFPLARRPALPGSLLEAGDGILRSGALAGDPAEVRRDV